MTERIIFWISFAWIVFAVYAQHRRWRLAFLGASVPILLFFGYLFIAHVIHENYIAAAVSLLIFSLWFGATMLKGYAEISFDRDAESGSPR